jgi:hypothetical protein
MWKEPASARLGQLIGFAWTRVIMARLTLAEGCERLMRALDVRRFRTEQAGQSLVEWSLATAVLAFVGIAAWQLAGTAITESINRTIASLNKAGS